jgi:hypothetical protein
MKTPEVIGEENQIRIPTPSELGVRVRRILAALIKYKLNYAKIKEKEESLNEKNKVKEEKRIEKMRIRQYEFSKKQKLDFQRTVLAYGVKRIPDSDLCDWTQFKELAELQKKSDESLESYLKKLIQLSKDIISYNEKNIKKMEDIGTGIENQEAVAEYPANEDGETFTLDRAKKILRRISYFDRLRKDVLHMTNVLFL